MGAGGVVLWCCGLARAAGWLGGWDRGRWPAWGVGPGGWELGAGGWELGAGSWELDLARGSRV